MLSVIFLGKAGVYPSKAPLVKHLSGATFLDRFLALLIIIRLGLKGMPGTNNLAYSLFGLFANYDCKKFL